MKKSLFLLTAIILNGLTINPVHATAETVISDGTWWGIKDLASYYQQRNYERKTICLSDVDCHNEMLAEAMNDAKYQAGYTIFQGKHFVISSINRETSDIEVYFENDDIDVSKYNYGWRDSDARNLYIGWFEEDDNRLFQLSDEDLLSGSGIGQHTLISQSNGTGLFPSQNFIPIAFNNNLDENSTGRIGYMIGSVFFRGRELIDVSECLANPGWISCDLYVSPSGEARYFTTINIDEPGPEIPPEIIEPTLPDEPIIEPTPSIDEPADPSIIDEHEPAESTIVPVPQPELNLEPVGVDTSNLGVIPESATINEEEASSDSPDKSQSELLEKGNETASIDVPLTSNTITNTVKKCNKNDFPWWFVVLVLAGDAIILWFFLPKHREKR